MMNQEIELLKMKLELAELRNKNASTVIRDLMQLLDDEKWSALIANRTAHMMLERIELVCGTEGQ